MALCQTDLILTINRVIVSNWAPNLIWQAYYKLPKIGFLSTFCRPNEETAHMWYDKTHEFRVTSYEFRVESFKARVDSLKVRVKIQKCEFKSTSYDFKFTSSRIIESIKSMKQPSNFCKKLKNKKWCYQFRISKEF